MHSTSQPIWVTIRVLDQKYRSQGQMFAAGVARKTAANAQLRVVFLLAANPRQFSPEFSKQW